MKSMSKITLAAMIAVGLTGSALAQGIPSHGDQRMSADPYAKHDADMMKMITDMKPDPQDPPSTKHFKAADDDARHARVQEPITCAWPA